MNALSKILSQIKGDLRVNNVSLKIILINYFFNPQFRVLLNHRIGKSGFNSRYKLARLYSIYLKSKLIVKRGCDISYNSKIGRGLILPHPIGIVIGDGVEIMDNVMIFQQVTLGSHGKKNSSKNYPIIESGVKIFSGAKIIGGITIGENAIIGANAVVNIDVPPNSIAVGIPCKIINKN